MDKYYFLIEKLYLASFGAQKRQIYRAVGVEVLNMAQRKKKKRREIYKNTLSHHQCASAPCCEKNGCVRSSKDPRQPQPNRSSGRRT
jgi:hypothetical protein